MGCGFLAMAMTAKLGQPMLAAGAIIYTVNMVVLIIPASLFFMLSISIGKYYSLGQHVCIGRLLRHAWILAILMALPVMFIFWYILPVLAWFNQPLQVALIVQEFFHASIWRVPLFFMSVCNQQLCYGMRRQKIDLYVNLIGAALFLVNAYSLIYGEFGFKAYGVAGLGFAYAIQTWFYFFFSVTIFYFNSKFHAIKLFSFKQRINMTLVLSLIKMGWPISLQIACELISLFLCAIFMGWINIASLAAYQIILQYQFLVFVPIFAISQAAGIMTSQTLHGPQPDGISTIGLAAVRQAGVISFAAGIMFVIFPIQLSRVFLNNADLQNLEIMRFAALFFFLMSIYQLFDAVRTVLTGLLRGLRDVIYPMIISISFCLIGISLGYFFTFCLKWNAAGLLLGWICGVILGTVILYRRWSYASKKLSLSL
ncbi:Multidrug resistance protein MdtK [Aquicella siphonis]|uniref:Multidrug resistance protein MdtK n=2 Tax=Aquicella siphonis TaxID=254247 RepID=A0A5E4PLA0_9COXI|nr:Multidrug resistance protein MdtK [Aquicella siphonis]